jgi:hypothetical protein
LRSKGIDAVSVQELGLKGAKDADILEVAASSSRCVVTNDVKDYARLAQMYADKMRQHSGVLFVPSSIGTSQSFIIAQLVIEFAESHKQPPGSFVAFLKYTK